MSFRISTQALHDTIAQAVLSSQQKVLKLQQGLADGRAIRVPSDDPVGTNVAMRYRQWLRAGTQYEKSIEVAISHLNATDAAFFGIQDAVTEARVLQNQGADSSNGTDARQALARQVDQVLQSLVDLGNERFAGVFIFGGTQSLTAPYAATFDENGFVDSVAQNSTGIDRPVIRQVGPDLSLSIHVSGSDVFGENRELFQTLIDLRKALQNEDQAGIEAAGDLLDGLQTQVISAHTFVGSLERRAEALRSRLQEDAITNEAGRTRIEDLDVVKATLEYNQSQVALDAALKAGSQILQASLLDYL
ncbi:MAG: flagellin [Candidatus Eisenbacteria bacterium]